MFYQRFLFCSVWMNGFNVVIFVFGWIFDYWVPVGWCFGLIWIWVVF